MPTQFTWVRFINKDECERIARQTDTNSKHEHFDNAFVVLFGRGCLIKVFHAAISKVLPVKNSMRC